MWVALVRKLTLSKVYATYCHRTAHGLGDAVHPGSWSYDSPPTVFGVSFRELLSGEVESLSPYFNFGLLKIAIARDEDIKLGAKI
jgi:hypothetical protein